MKSIVLTQPGDVSRLLEQETSRPEPKPNEVLIRVQSISINPVDAQTRAGKGVYERVRNASPLILGWDVSGTVTESQSPLFAIGDEVFGMVNFPEAGKAYAEYVAAPADQLAKKPANIIHGEAAAATLACLIAWQVLVTKGNIRSGERVLIPAASGGTGHYAVQIAKHIGAYVIATASANNKDFVMSLGADEFIDYKTQTLKEATKDVDFVFDSLGNRNIDESLEVIKPGGRLITLKGKPGDTQMQKAALKNIQLGSHLVEPSGTNMASIAALLAGGSLKSYISKTFTFDNMKEAHLQIESGKTVGKIVIEM